MTREAAEALAARPSLEVVVEAGGQRRTLLVRAGKRILGERP